MRGVEYKVIRFLIFIGLLFLNYHVLMLFTSFIAPEGFLNDVKRIGGFFINLLGLHALFAFGTFFYSRMYLNIKIKFYLLGLSIVTPLVYLFFNLEFLYTIEIPDLSILIASFFLVNLFIKDFKYNYVRQYLNVLIDPFYKDESSLLNLMVGLLRRGRLYFLYIWVSVWTFVAVGNVHHSFELLESKYIEATPLVVSETEKDVSEMETELNLALQKNIAMPKLFGKIISKSK